MTQPQSPDAILADFVAGTTGNDIPETAIDAAMRQVIDCVGVTLAARAEPAGRIITSTTADVGGTPQSRVIGTGIRTSMMMAAWANGSLAHLLDFDDTGFSHPTACMLPVALAVGEHRHSTGRDVVSALVLGYEVFERLAASGRGNEPELRSRGWHPTSIYGTPASAAVAGWLLGLDADGIRTAMSLAASSASGLTQPFGSWGKGLNAGHAGQAGILAALLARDGYRTDPDGLGGTYGLFSAVVGEGKYDLSGLEDELGQRWSIVDPGISIKPYPCCTSNLRAVDATLAIRRREGLEPDEIERVVVHVHPDLLHTLRFERPREGFQGKFSLDYTVAAAALDGELVLASFSDEAAARPEFCAMLERVHLERHPEWPIEDRRDNPVEIETTDGRRFEERVDHELGTRANPLSLEDIRGKFHTCARQWFTEARADVALEAVEYLPQTDDVVAVMDSLTDPQPASIPGT